MFCNSQLPVFALILLCPKCQLLDATNTLVEAAIRCVTHALQLTRKGKACSESLSRKGSGNGQSIRVPLNLGKLRCSHLDV